MKPLAALGLLLLVPFAFLRADDSLLINGDFSNGSTGWAGDIDDAPADVSGKSSAPGITVTLLPDAPTHVSQQFRPKDSNFILTLTCTPSAGCTFTGAGKVADVATSIGSETATTSYQDINGQMRTAINFNYAAYSSSFKTATIIVVDRDLNEVFPSSVRIDPTSAKAQTVMLPMNFGANHDCVFYVAFPPGAGKITLNKISLVKGAPPPPATNPFAVPPPTEADNVLAKQSWAGDVGDPDASDDAMADASLGAAAPSGDVTLRMKGGSIAEISKTFRAPSDSLRITITATPSKHCELNTSSEQTTLRDFVRKVGQGGAGDSSFPSDSGPAVTAAPNTSLDMTIYGFMAVLVDRKTNAVSTCSFAIDSQKAETQTQTTQAFVNANDDYTLYLVLPTGHGAYTIGHVYAVNAETGDAIPPAAAAAPQ